MDTRFWGPDGWKLLHSIVEKYPLNPSITEQNTYKNFMNSLKHVLPCIYCRRSLDQYTRELPVEGYLKNRYTLRYWLYLIHNKVNDKLRKQGLNDEPDPDFKKVCEFYYHYYREINIANCVNMPGWDFLYTIVFNYPEKKEEIETIRYTNYIIFFNYLAKVLPFEKVRQEYTKILNNTDFNKILESRNNFKKWFFKTEKTIKKVINENCLKYSDRCNLIEMYRAGCTGKNDKKPTCRKK